MESRSQAIREMAVKKSDAGVDIEVIYQTTGLTHDKINSLYRNVYPPPCRFNNCGGFLFYQIKELIACPLVAEEYAAES